MKVSFLLPPMILSLLVVSGCAPDALRITPEAPGDLAGFWNGLWHGFIVLFTFVVSLFNDQVGIYEVANKGHLYDLGFVLGAMTFFGSSGGGATKRKSNSK